MSQSYLHGYFYKEGAGGNEKYYRKGAKKVMKLINTHPGWTGTIAPGGVGADIALGEWDLRMRNPKTGKLGLNPSNLNYFNPKANARSSKNLEKFIKDTTFKNTDTFLGRADKSTDRMLNAWKTGKAALGKVPVDTIASILQIAKQNKALNKNRKNLLKWRGVLKDIMKKRVQEGELDKARQIFEGRHLTTFKDNTFDELVNKYK